MFRRMSGRAARLAALTLGAALVLPVIPLTAAGAAAAISPAASTPSSSDFTTVPAARGTWKDVSAEAATDAESGTPTLGADPARLTQAEFMSSVVTVSGQGMTPGATGRLMITDPLGTQQVVDPYEPVVDEDGTWTVYLRATGTPVPGTYILSAILDGAIVVETTLEVLEGDVLPITVTSTVTPATPDLATLLGEGVQIHSAGYQPGEHVTAKITYPGGNPLIDGDQQVDTLFDTHADEDGVVDYTYVGGRGLIAGHYSIDLHGPYSRETTISLDVTEGEDPPTFPLTLTVSPTETNLLRWRSEGVGVEVSGLKVRDRPQGTLIYPDGQTTEDLYWFDRAGADGIVKTGIGVIRDRPVGTYTVTVTTDSGETLSAQFHASDVPDVEPGDPSAVVDPETIRMDDFKDEWVSLESEGWVGNESTNTYIVRPDGRRVDFGYWPASVEGTLSRVIDSYDVGGNPVVGEYTVEIVGEFSGTVTVTFTITATPVEEDQSLTTSVATTTPTTWLNQPITAKVVNFGTDNEVYFNVQAPGSEEWTEVDAVLTDEDGSAETALTITAEEAASLPLGTWRVKAFDVYNDYNLTTSFEVTADAVDPEPEGPEATTVAATAATVHVGEAPTVAVSVSTPSGAVTTGAVQVSENGTVLGQAALTAGRADVTLDPLPVGIHHLVVTYGGSGTAAASTGEVTLEILAGSTSSNPAPSSPATSTTVTGKVLTRPVVMGRKVAIQAIVRADGGQEVTGRVVVKIKGKRIGVIELRDGRGKLVVGTRKLGQGRHVLRLRFAGASTLAPSTDTVTVKVRSGS